MIMRITQNHSWSCFEALSQYGTKDVDEQYFLEEVFLFILKDIYPESRPYEPTIAPEIISDFLDFFSVYLEKEKESEDLSMQSQYPITWLKEEEIATFDAKDEFLALKQAFIDEHIYELLKLDYDLHGYTTLQHICGVHFLALKIAKQLHKLGIAIDIALVSGAALSHDLGKYGVKKDDVGKMAYYHYYYSDQWLLRHNLPMIRNIAVNHSTWDLELESLSIESLVLIYSDFRVKADNKGVMRYFTLDDSYQVILDKLDNVDEDKRKRYDKVYQKLKDFEFFLKETGVDTSSSKKIISCVKRKERETDLRNEQIVDEYIYKGVQSSCYSMNLFRSEKSLRGLFLDAKAPHQISLLKQLLDHLESHYIYLLPGQKSFLIQELNRLIYHDAFDIRKQSALILGGLIGKYDQVYRKWIPPSEDKEKATSKRREYFERLLVNLYGKNKDIKTLRSDRRIYPMSLAIAEAIRLDNRQELIKIVDEYLMDSKLENDIFLSMQILSALHDRAGFDISVYLHRYDQKLANEKQELISHYFFLFHEIHDSKIMQQFENDIRSRWENDVLLAGEKDTKIYLSNLKSETSEIYKFLNIDYLFRHLDPSNEDQFMNHLLNILKASESEYAKSIAGNYLIKSWSRLGESKLNDITVNLLRSIEIVETTKESIIPYYLGRALAKLPHNELIAILFDIKDNIQQLKEMATINLIESLSIALSYSIKHLSDKTVEIYIEILLRSLASDNLYVRTSSLSLINKYFFKEYHTKDSSLKFLMFTAKKMLNMALFFEKTKADRMSFSHYVHSVYTFISSLQKRTNCFVLDSKGRKKVVISDVFDPINAHHIQLIKQLIDESFEVYLLQDEFNTVKNTAPSLHRAHMIQLAIAGILHAHVIPMDMFINVYADDSKEKLQNYLQTDFSFYNFENNSELSNSLKENFLNLDFLKSTSYFENVRWFVSKEWFSTSIMDELVSEYVKKHGLYRDVQEDKPIVEKDYEILKNEKGVFLKRLSTLEVASVTFLKQEDSCLYVQLEGESSEYDIHNLAQIALNEALIEAYHLGIERFYAQKPQNKYHDWMIAQGAKCENNDLYFLLNPPGILVLDVQSTMRHNYRKNEKIRRTIASSRVKLISELHKGKKDQTILVFDRSVLYEKMLDQLATRRYNSEQTLFVPMGSLFYKMRIPGYQTQSYYLDEVVDPKTGDKYFVEEQNYYSIENQKDRLKGYARDLVLLDDLVVDSQRMNNINEIIDKKTHVNEFLIGIATKEVLNSSEKFGFPISAVVELDEINEYYFESEFYPLIGGISSPGNDASIEYHLSNNLILPMVDSGFDNDPEFSVKAIENAKSIMQEVEMEFIKQKGRRLRLYDLYEIFLQVRIPDVYYMPLQNVEVFTVYRDLEMMIKKLRK